MADTNATDVLAPVTDWAKEPELVQTRDASNMQPNFVSRGTEEQKAATLAEQGRTMGIEDSNIPIIGDLNVWAERFDQTVKKSFLYGDNAAVQIFYDLKRIEGAGETDPAWKTGANKQWLDKNASKIDVSNQWRYMQTKNQVEAESMLNDSEVNNKNMQILNARSATNPFSTFAARGIAGLVDIDLPFTLASGGVGGSIKAGINATKFGRLLSGAAAGALAGAGVQTGAYYSNPDEDWTSIPVAGLMGLGLGLIGGAIAKSPHINERVSEPANTKLQDVVQEYNDTLEEGIPQARQDIRQEAHSSPEGLSRQAEQNRRINEVDDRSPIFRGMSRQESDSLDTGTWTPKQYQVQMYTTSDRKAADLFSSGSPYTKTEDSVLREGRIKQNMVTITEKQYDSMFKKFRSENPGTIVTTQNFISTLRSQGIAGVEGKAISGFPETRIFDPTDVEWTPLSNTRTPQAISLETIDAPTGHVEDVAPDGFGRSTLGAGQQGDQSLSVGTIDSTRVVDEIQSARTANQQSGHVDEFFGNHTNLRARSDGLARGVSRFQDVADATGLVSDFSRLMRSGSAVAQNMAYELFENASGKVRNNRSAAMLQDNYQKQILGNFLPYHDAFTEFAETQGAGVWQRVWNQKLRQDFDIQVVQELQSRKYDSPQSRATMQVPDHIKKAADAVDKTFAREIDVGKGRAGEGSWKGFEDLKQESGYFPQKWVGRKMLDIVKRDGKQALINAVREAYRAQHATMKDKDASIWAAAMVNRALKSEDGLTTNLVSVLQSDGRGMLEDTLRANGLSQKEIDRLIKGLTGNMEETGRPGQTKQRIDVDMRFVASNGIKMIDLIDTDINKIIGQRARRTAGQGALARKGIYSRQDWELKKEAIIEEQKLQGQTPAGTTLGEKVSNVLDRENEITPEFMDDLFTYFSGSPLAGGLSPMYSRMRKLTNLSLLNQLGMTQLAEFGPMISAVGWKRFAEHAGEAFNARLRNKDSDLVKELEHMNIFVPEERMFRDDLTFDYEKANPSSPEYMQRFDAILNKAQRLQGFTSGFYEVRKIQQRIALTSGIDKLITGIKTGSEQFSPDRLRDIGFEPKLMERVKKYVDNGTVEFDANGKLNKLNLEKWDAIDTEDFTLAMNRQTNILVQKAMAGESSIMFHRDGLASLFFHLKSFPLLAMEKQAARNINMADQQALTTFIYGMATAGAAYTARQALNLNTDNLTASRIATGAIGLSNMTGWIPMWSDPIAGLLGLDSLQMGGGKYGSNSIISLPASLTTLDRLAQAPSALLNAINPFDDLKNGDIRAIQTIPIFGNMYGISAMLNAMKN